MCPERHTADVRRTQCGDPTEELQDEPEPDHHPGWHQDHLTEVAEEDEGSHLPLREKDDVGAEHAGDSPRRPNQGDRRRRTEEDLRQTGNNSSEEIEEKI